MIEPPTAPDNDIAPERQNTKRLGIKEFIITLIIIVLVWLGRRFFGN